jgi:hypothetical protein
VRVFFSSVLIGCGDFFNNNNNGFRVGLVYWVSVARPSSRRGVCFSRPKLVSRRSLESDFQRLHLAGLSFFLLS